MRKEEGGVQILCNAHVPRVFAEKEHQTDKHAENEKDIHQKPTFVQLDALFLE